MPAQAGTFKDALSRASEIEITVTGRKSGRQITLPIWFVFENDTLYLLPVRGSDTQWYRNVLKNSAMRIKAASQTAEIKISPVSDTKQVSAVLEKFRGKYGPGDVKKYYSKFDAAVIAPLA